jgi:hypothetical protein
MLNAEATRVANPDLTNELWPFGLHSKGESAKQGIGTRPRGVPINKTRSRSGGAAEWWQPVVAG